MRFGRKPNPELTILLISLLASPLSLDRVKEKPSAVKEEVSEMVQTEFCKDFTNLSIKSFWDFWRGTVCVWDFHFQ